MAYGGRMKIRALVDGMMHLGRETLWFKAGQVLDVDDVVGGDLIWFGHAEQVWPDELRPEPEVAALEPAERATMSKGRRKKTGL